MIATAISICICGYVLIRAGLSDNPSVLQRFFILLWVGFYFVASVSTAFRILNLFETKPEHYRVFAVLDSFFLCVSMYITYYWLGIYKRILVKQRFSDKIILGLCDPIELTRVHLRSVNFAVTNQYLIFEKLRRLYLSGHKLTPELVDVVKRNDYGAVKNYLDSLVLDKLLKKVNYENTEYYTALG